jgi:hypothetical protein
MYLSEYLGQGISKIGWRYLVPDFGWITIGVVPLPEIWRRCYNAMDALGWQLGEPVERMPSEDAHGHAMTFPSNWLAKSDEQDKARSFRGIAGPTRG